VVGRLRSAWSEGGANNYGYGGGGGGLSRRIISCGLLGGNKAVTVERGGAVARHQGALRTSGWGGDLGDAGGRPYLDLYYKR